jgi:hypothetical protein
MPARTLTFVLGLWEFFAAFAIPRARPSLAAAWILGLVAAALSVVGMLRARARLGTLAVGALLLLSAFAIHHRSSVAWWNDVVVGAALALLSLVPGTMYESRRTRAAA